MSALTALMPSRTAAPVARSGRKRKSAGGLALLAGLGAAALKAKSRRAATPSA